MGEKGTEMERGRAQHREGKTREFNRIQKERWRSKRGERVDPLQKKAIRMGGLPRGHTGGESCTEKIQDTPQISTANKTNQEAKEGGREGG